MSDKFDLNQSWYIKHILSAQAHHDKGVVVLHVEQNQKDYVFKILTTSASDSLRQQHFNEITHYQNPLLNGICLDVQLIENISELTLGLNQHLKQHFVLDIHSPIIVLPFVKTVRNYLKTILPQDLNKHLCLFSKMCDAVFQ